MCAADSGSLLSRCGAWVSSLEHLREAPAPLPTPTPTHPYSQAREESHLQATEIVLLWPLGARLTLMACHVKLREAKQVILSPFSPVGRVLAPCYSATLPWALGLLGVVFPW